MRILVIKPSSLGDIIHGLQVAAIIKKHLPEVIIDWVVRDCWDEVVIASGLVDEVFLFHRHGGVRKFCKLISQVRARKYDIVIDMQGLARSGVLTFFSRSKRKIGRWDARECSILAYNEIIEHPQNNHKHALDILLQFLPKFGIFPKFEACLTFNLPDKARFGISDPYVLFFPESRRIEKQWPYFGELIEKTAQMCGNKLSLVIVGQNTKHTKNFDEKNIFNLTGKTNLIDVLTLIRGCSLLVANDSAPIHIGAAMQKPMIALFGPTDPTRFGPYPTSSDIYTILTNKALNKMTVDTVFGAVVKNIDKFLHDD